MFLLYNNLWGKGNASAGGSQCTTLESARSGIVAWDTTWNWSGGSTDVKSCSSYTLTVSFKPAQITLNVDSNFIHPLTRRQRCPPKGTQPKALLHQHHPHQLEMVVHVRRLEHRCRCFLRSLARTVRLGRRQVRDHDLVECSRRSLAGWKRHRHDQRGWLQVQALQGDRQHLDSLLVRHCPGRDHRLQHRSQALLQ